MVWPAVIGALGGIAAGGIGMAGQSAANRTNLRIAREYRDWQERMSNTEAQRRVKDLQAAGLNPMLAITQGMASTPNPTVPEVQNEGAQMAEGVQHGVNSAITAMNLELMKAQVETQKAVTRKTQAEASMTEADIPWSAQNAQMRSEKLFSEMKKLAHEVGTALHEQEKKGLDVKKGRIDVEEMMPLVVQYQKLLNEMAKLEIPEKSANAAFFEAVPESKWIMVLKQLLFGGGRSLPWPQNYR